jgi:hypothetical protein
VPRRVLAQHTAADRADELEAHVEALAGAQCVTLQSDGASPP